MVVKAVVVDVLIHATKDVILDAKTHVTVHVLAAVQDKHTHKFYYYYDGKIFKRMVVS